MFQVSGTLLVVLLTVLAVVTPATAWAFLSYFRIAWNAEPSEYDEHGHLIDAHH